MTINNSGTTEIGNFSEGKITKGVTVHKKEEDYLVRSG